MYNLFTRNDIRLEPGCQRTLESALSCCVVRLHRGLYSVTAACPAPRHSLFARFIDDEEWIRICALGARSTATPADRAVFQRERHRAALLGADPVKDGAIAYASAAVVHGLPVLTSRFEERQYISRKRSLHRPGVRVRHRRLSAGECCDEAGQALTNPERTIADLAADISLSSAVMAADMLTSARTRPHPRYSSTLNERLRLTRRERTARLSAQKGLCPKSTARARLELVLELAQGLSESPAESFAVVVFHRLGLTGRYRQQVAFRDATGRTVARVDFLFDDTVVVEVDGWSKYDVRTHATAGEALKQEKLREDWLRRKGHRVVRLEWADLLQPRRTARKLQLAGVLP